MPPTIPVNQRNITMITEQDMREFFQKMIDTVSQLSTQASKVEGLEARVNDLTNRINALETENHSLRADLAGTQATLNDTQGKLDATRRDYEHEISVSQGLRETIVSRDSRVSEVSHNLEVERDAHSTTLRERDEARNEVGDLQALVQSLRDQLTHAHDVSNGHRERADRAEAQVREVTAQLEQIRSVLRPLTVPSQDVATS